MGRVGASALALFCLSAQALKPEDVPYLRSTVRALSPRSVPKNAHLKPGRDAAGQLVFSDQLPTENLHKMEARDRQAPWVQPCEAMTAKRYNPTGSASRSCENHCAVVLKALPNSRVSIYVFTGGVCE